MAVCSIVKKSELEGALRIDGEYYQPKYLGAAKHLRGHLILNEFIRRIIHPTEIKRVYEDKGCPFLLSQNVGNNMLDFSQAVFISEEVAKLIPKNKVEFGDVLMVRTGDIGKSAPYLGEPKNLFASAHVLIIKIKDISGVFLSTYFNTKYGRTILQRGCYGAVQPEIAPSYVQTIPVPRFRKEIEKKVEAKVVEAHKFLGQSKLLYLQAEQMLLSTLGFNRLDLSQPKHYTVPLKNAQKVNRVDAEHFQPKYDKLIQWLKNKGKTKRIGEFLAETVQKGVTPEYDSEGGIVVVNSQHLGRYCINFEMTDRTTKDFWERNRRAQIRYLDVMVYATGAYIGRTNSYLEKHKALAGVDVILIRPNPTCNPLYLAVYLNALLGLWQAEKFASGSAQRHIYPNDIAQFLVYLPPDEFQDKIANLVILSYQIHKKAKALLEEAKDKVEKTILEKS